MRRDCASEPLADDPMVVSIIIPTFNSRVDYFKRVLDAVVEQRRRYSGLVELIVVNNASTDCSYLDLIDSCGTTIKVIKEEQPGLTNARLAGLAASTGEVLIFVDDDNVLARDYVETATLFAQENPDVGAFGGRTIAEYEIPPASWIAEFAGLLAVVDHGDSVRVHRAADRYPAAAPIGAGLVLRRAAAMAWVDALDKRSVNILDRTAGALTSGGDNDIVISILKADYSVAYVPALSLLHLIAQGRLQPQYLGRLNRGIQESWVQVLALHGMCPWPSIDRWTLPLRKVRAFFRDKGWNYPLGWIRWQGHCGRFEGLSKVRES